MVKVYRFPAFSVLVVTLVLASLLSACTQQQAAAPAQKESQKTSVQNATPAPASKASQSRVTMKVAWTPTMSFAPFYVAEEKGYFKELGLDIEPETFKSAQDSIAFLAKGDIQAILGSASAGAFNAFYDGMDIRIVLPGTYLNKGHQALSLVVRKDLLDSGKVKEVKDLKGMKIAVTGKGVTSEYYIAKILEKGGLTLNDLDVSYMGYPDMLVALSNKALDAAQEAPPYDRKAESTGVARVFVRDAGLDILNTVVYFGGKFVREQPEAGKKFVAAWLKASREIYGPKFLNDEYVKIYSKWTKVSEEDIKNSERYYYDPNGQMSAQALMDQQTLWMKLGHLKYNKPMDLSKLIDKSFVDAALKELGEYKP